jgi:hypothetical protein
LENSDVISFVRIKQLNWIGYVNRMGSKRKAIILREIDQETEGGIV